MNAPSRWMNRPRGLTLFELLVVLAILACAFVAILDVFQLLGRGLQVETTRAELVAHTQGRLYDIVSELRQAAGCSPNFYVEQDASKPPRISFDLVDSIDMKGNITWGNKVTYRLEKAPDAQIAAYAYLAIVPGQILRDETAANGLVSTTLVEELVPYQFSDNGVTKWGFNVSRNGSALTLSISRFGSVDARNASASNARLISTLNGVYFLRNSQLVTPLQ